MDVRLNAEIKCADGAGGHATALVLNPVTGVATHLVIDPKGHGHEQFLLPLDQITATSAKQITVRCNQADLSELPPFMRTVRVAAEGLDTMDAQALMGAEFQSGVGYQDFSFGGGGSSSVIKQEAIPDSELAVHHDIPVEATDGKVGAVDGFIVDPQSGLITHLVLREGHLFKKDVNVPVEQINRIGEAGVYLSVAKDAV